MSVLLSERINYPDVREFFPQGFFPDIEDASESKRSDKPVNWWQRPYRSIPQPIHWARNRERREWSMRYWRSLQRREEREAKQLEKWRRERECKNAANEAHGESTWPPRSSHKLPLVDIPMVHGRFALNCGKEFYLHLNEVRYTRLDREKLPQIAMAMHLQGYIKVDTGYYVLARGSYERTVKFHDCTLNPTKAWVVSSVR